MLGLMNSTYTKVDNIHLICRDEPKKSCFYCNYISPLKSLIPEGFSLIIAAQNLKMVVFA